VRHFNRFLNASETLHCLRRTHCENIGFEKFDILSQRGIGHIDDR
jgi:hypothetical protein